MNQREFQNQLPVRMLLGCVAIGLLAVIAWLLRTYPPTVYGWMPACVFHEMTGLHCPGCGGTRAVMALADGDIGRAIRSNPLLVIGLPLICVVVAWQRRRRLAGGPASPATAWVLFVLMLVYFVIRNVPSPTRSPLAPPPVEKVMPSRSGNPQLPESVGERSAVAAVSSDCGAFGHTRNLVTRIANIAV